VRVRDDGAMPDDAQRPPTDLSSLFGMAMDLQNQVVAAQEQAAGQVVEGQAGGGAVRIEVTGGFEFQSVTIAADAVEAGDVELLQDLVLAALRDAVARIGEIHSAADPLGGMGLDMGSVLGGLSGALGPVDDEDDEGDDVEGGAGAPGN
jgi:nucleoid-associated protein EbfC